MKCPNQSCGGKVDESVNSVGGGSRYCLDACGYYEELPAGSMKKPKRADHLEPVPPARRKKVPVRRG